MNNLIALDIKFGALALAIFYATWHDYRADNRRDAKLLTAVGSLALVGTAVAWAQ
ncbi:hypothetical protein [Rhodoferax sp. PAMC 29310]|uniref:hypothetical protein n=1 Tax=Rhodoferax sp. PAMC 29310 TaxID=2822760 RepID=UPI001B333A81|nr:hypothetical protein [Rhodoferax sp. PAMC 29310]